MQEIWKDIKGYENLYQVSNLGNVRSLNYHKENRIQNLKTGTSTGGYLFVILCKNNQTSAVKIHKLVAEAFIPNPDNKPCIDHINTIRTDNNVSNLRWCNNKENMNNPNTINKISKSRIGKRVYSKPIVQLTKTNEYICKWDALIDIENELGYRIGNISACCRGERKSAYGYRWVFFDDYKQERVA